MIDHEAIVLAIRNQLNGLSVCSTGTMTLEATATGYARATGSFLTDGFAPGMEVTPVGFVSNPVAVITGVTALTLTTTARTAEAAAGGRSLTVKLPEKQGWENVHVEPADGRPYVEEDYLPGAPPELQTVGPGGRIEGLPMYVLRVYAPANTGREALARYTRAILALLPPKQSFSLGNGDTLRVRGDLAPYPGQLLNDQPGWAVVPITIPLRVESTNLL